MLNVQRVSCFTDGATEGHNGKLGTVKRVGIGYWIPEKRISRSVKYWGQSNNEAEYMALIEAMRTCLSLGLFYVDFYLDSELVVNGANKNKFTKNKRMQRFKNQVAFLKSKFKSVTFTWISRDENEHADLLSKDACLLPLANTFMYDNIKEQFKPRLIEDKNTTLIKKGVIEHKRMPMRQILLAGTKNS